jgi:hypothetical protein
MTMQAPGRRQDIGWRWGRAPHLAASTFEHKVHYITVLCQTRSLDLRETGAESNL